MQPETLQKRYSVSHETLEKLQVYHALLLKWQKAINLVSPATLDNAWERHFADSMQLAQLIPEDVKMLVDLGSGAGFPGLVLAIMRPDIQVHLIESDERKGQFLRTVSRETQVGAIVKSARIEHVAKEVAPDIVTARALGDLSSLCEYCMLWAEKNPDLRMIFPKGKEADNEIQTASHLYNFEVEKVPSQTDPLASILVLTALARA